MKTEKMGKYIHMRVSEEDKDAIARAAAAMGLQPTAWIRMVIALELAKGGKND